MSLKEGSRRAGRFSPWLEMGQEPKASFSGKQAQCLQLAGILFGEGAGFAGHVLGMG